ncbi:hypothetical protein MMSP_5373 [Mycobacterium sp. 012931]|nr:hypothetical protein MMSP_5373 [Mycobacterium sp. 012931]
MSGIRHRPTELGLSNKLRRLAGQDSSSMLGRLPAGEWCRYLG